MPLALIPAVLSFFGKNWKLLLVAAALLAVVGWVAGTQATISHLKAQVASYRTVNDQLHAANQLEHATVQKLLKVNAQNQRVCTAAESAARQNLSIAKREATAAKARALNYGSIRHAIQIAPVDRTPVSPVVRDTVDRLWQ